MPVTPGRASLWFENRPESQKRYDDMMMANIEFKSEDSESEDYAMVFTRKKKEKFFEWSDLALKDIATMKNRQQESPDHKYKQYGYKGGESTYWKTWEVEKRLLGFGFGYLLLREIPVRNFYARGIIMGWFFAKYWDQYGLPVPWVTNYNRPSACKVADLWEGARDIEVFDVHKKVLTQFDLPDASNRVRPSVEWYAAQPGHMKFENTITAKSYPSVFTRQYSEAHWDGTFNMPLHALAHPLHKDTCQLQWSAQQY